MKRSSRPRKPANLPESVQHNLNTYALAAGAAGVGMLALAQPAEGKIVYTRANQPIPANIPFDLDLNHDGISDFQFLFNTSRRTSISASYARMRIGGLQTNKIWEVSSANHSCAAALPKNTKVGPKRPFQSRFLTMFEKNTHIGSGTIFGPWLKLKGPSYLGLKFVFKGTTHFAWARVGLSAKGQWTLFAYAYETIPNKPIITGMTKGPTEHAVEARGEALTPTPATLGMLAFGSSATAIWRREASTTKTE